MLLIQHPTSCSWTNIAIDQSRPSDIISVLLLCFSAVGALLLPVDCAGADEAVQEEDDSMTSFLFKLKHRIIIITVIRWLLVIGY